MRLAALLVAAQTAAYLAYLAGGPDALNIDSDTGVFTFVSTAMTLACAIQASGWPLRVAVGVLATDDLLALHERVSPHAGPFPAWPLIFLPLLAAVLIGLARDRRTWPGLALLVTAIGLELSTAVVFAIASDGGWLYRVEVLLEENAELAGWTLIAVALGQTRRLRRPIRHANPSRSPATARNSCSASAQHHGSSSLDGTLPPQ